MIVDFVYKLDFVLYIVWCKSRVHFNKLSFVRLPCFKTFFYFQSDGIRRDYFLIQHCQLDKIFMAYNLPEIVLSMTP